MRPSFDELLAFAANQLEADKALAVQRHLQASSSDANVVREIQRTLAVMRADDTVAAPDSVLARARALFEKAVRVEVPSLAQTLRRIIAQLTFDNRRQPALAGYRSVAQAVALSFAADGVEIDLQIEPPSQRESNEWRMLGQVSAEPRCGTRTRAQSCARQ